MVSSIHVPGTSVAYCIDYSYFNIRTVSTLDALEQLYTF